LCRRVSRHHLHQVLGSLMENAPATAAVAA
jgi:hypothetical protein